MKTLEEKIKEGLNEKLQNSLVIPYTDEGIKFISEIAHKHFKELEEKCAKTSLKSKIEQMRGWLDDLEAGVKGGYFSEELNSITIRFLGTDFEVEQDLIHKYKFIAADKCGKVYLYLNHPQSSPLDPNIFSGAYNEYVFIGYLNKKSSSKHSSLVRYLIENDEHILREFID